MDAFVCKDSDVDEAAPDYEEQLLRSSSAIAGWYRSLARAVIDSRELLTQSLYEYDVRKTLSKYASYLVFGMEHPARRRRISVDVDAMVNAWVPLVSSLALCHDVDERDLASSKLDEQLAPILAAPVKQIREFYAKLVDALKADTKIPWAVWKMFEFWGSEVLSKIDKEELVGLKTEIAKRIAESSISQIPAEDWMNAMIGALQWRSPEKLKQIETGLKTGAKPRVRGKESCLFLEVAGTEVLL